MEDEKPREAHKWVEFELNGYPNIESMPDYRVMRVDSYGSFIGAFQRADKLQVPVSILPESMRDYYQHAYMGSGISAYTALLEGDKTGTVVEQWPINLAVHHASKLTPEMQCVSAWKEIPIGAIVRLLDSVRTRVLGFAIDLERESPDAGEMPIGSQPLSEEKMTQIFNTNIAGNVGNLANSGKSINQTSSMAVGDWATLEHHLSQFGLASTDLSEMKTEMESAVQSDEKSKLALAGKWIGKLIGKIAGGVSGVGVEIASATVAKAIAIYLGLPLG